MARTGRPKTELTLTEQEGEQLVRWSRRAKSSQALALRSKIVLACAKGTDNKSVATAQFSCAATLLLSVPFAQASTILERSAKAWEDFARCDHRTSCSPSCSVRVSSVLGRPVLAIPTVYDLWHELTVRHTSWTPCWAFIYRAQIWCRGFGH